MSPRVVCRRGVRKTTPVNGSNVNKDFAMGSRPLTPDALDRIPRRAQDGGKSIVRQAFGDQGPGRDVDLTQRELIAQAAARGRTAGTLEEAPAQQAQLLGPQQPCPGCGRPCPVSTPERPGDVQGGSFAHRQPVCSCPTCRRAFSPALPPAGIAGDA